MIVLLTMLFSAANSDLPSTADLENPRVMATALLFADGTQMGQYYRENRIPVNYDQISPNVVNALIATEDQRFRVHSGVDVRGTVRAAVFLGKRGGASTLTQQLSKMLFTDRAPNFSNEHSRNSKSGSSARNWNGNTRKMRSSRCTSTGSIGSIRP
ncbi:MAG: transglycosylase domain-containing protein [Flavobacteriales bacterium]|nr:transglycosylase domain-containing protein [Flavobacteriales bacterium]